MVVHLLVCLCVCVCVCVYICVCLYAWCVCSTAFIRLDLLGVSHLCSYLGPGRFSGRGLAGRLSLSVLVELSVVVVGVLYSQRIAQVRFCSLCEHRQWQDVPRCTV